MTQFSFLVLFGTFSCFPRLSSAFLPLTLPPQLLEVSSYLHLNLPATLPMDSLSKTLLSSSLTDLPSSAVIAAAAGATASAALLLNDDQTASMSSPYDGRAEIYNPVLSDAFYKYIDMKNLNIFQLYLFPL